MNLFEKNLKQAIVQKRVAHLCVDNQAYFPMKHQHPDYIDQFLACSKRIADITQSLSPYLTTVNIAYRIRPEYLDVRKGIYPNFSSYCQTVYYDAVGLKAYRRNSKAKNLEKIEVDFIKPNFQKEHTYIKEYNDAFEEDGLSNFLALNKKDILVVSGMYLSACIKASLESALKYGFKPILLNDCTMDFSENCKTTGEMQQSNLELTTKTAFQWGIPTIESPQLLNLCQTMA